MAAERRRRPSRRTVILGAAAFVVVGAGIPTAIGLAGGFRRGGKLVGPLLRSDVFTVAHRGGSADWPEMSHEAYRQSADRGVDALEMSVARSSDGVWFGLHDTTLDRTSKTTGFVASEHTWAEISAHAITLAPVHGGRQEPRPYYRLTDLAAEFGSTHTLFVDPKAVDASHHPELIRLLESLVPTASETFVAKAYCTTTSWADLARKAGLRSWGFYYGSEIEAKPELLTTTEAHWDLLGLDDDASAGSWAAVRALGKAVIAHVVPDRAAAERALAHGARGLMIGGVAETLPLG